MKINSAMYSHKTDVGIAHAVSGSLDGRDRDRGSVECAMASADNVAEAFGMLVEMLHAKGVLDDGDVKKFLNYAFKVDEG